MFPRSLLAPATSFRQRLLNAMFTCLLVFAAGLSSPIHAQTARGMDRLNQYDYLVPSRSNDAAGHALRLEETRNRVRRSNIASELQIARDLRRQGDADWARGAGFARQLVDLDTARVQVEIRIDPARHEALMRELVRHGFERRFNQGNGTLLQGWLPLDALDAIERLDGIGSVQPARQVQFLQGASNTQGVAAGRAARWHTGGIDGTGLTIAVIDGFNNQRATLQASGDWPPAARLTTVSMHSGAFGANNSAHGMATLEIAYDVAPGANFIAYDTNLVSEWAAAIRDAVDVRGADIISASLGAPLDGIGDGSPLPDSVAEAAEYARSKGVLVVNAAGNEREVHWGGLYNPASLSPAPGTSGYDSAHAFTPGGTGPLGATLACAAYDYSLAATSYHNSIPALAAANCLCLPSGFPVTAAVFWDDWANVNHDYDVFLYRMGGSVGSPTWARVSQSWYIQDGSTGATPQEYLSYSVPAANTSPGCASGRKVFAFQIAHYSASANTPRNIQLFQYWDMSPSLQVPARSLGFPGDSPGVVTVAAIDVASALQESYSSEGPILAPGGGLPTGSEALKPDVTSFANVDTQSYGAGEFNGTSAATPHVAGMAALLWQRMGGPGVADMEDVRAALLDIAGTGSNDLGAAGPDTKFGHGRVRFQVEDDLVFTQQPSDTDVNAPITPAVTVAVVDDENEPVLHGLVNQIALALDADPSAGTATLSGTTASVALGEAAFPTLALDTAGQNYTLAANASTLDSQTLASSSSSSAFDIQAAVVTYSLSYTAGANGSISGNASQTVAHGDSGTAVTAVPASGYHFVDWSDGSTANPRTDANVTADISVTANFDVSPSGAFTSGNVVVYRVGSGTAALTNAATQVYLDEFDAITGALVQSLPMPTSVDGSNRRCVAAGTSSSEGFLSRSSDGQHLVGTCYDANTGTTSIANTNGSSAGRVVFRMGVDTVADTTTVLSDFSSTGNPRSAASSNGTHLWMAGSGNPQGTRYAAHGATSSELLLSQNARVVRVFDNQLYISVAAAIHAIGSGLPTSGAQTSTSLPFSGGPTRSSIYGYYFADLSDTVPGLDTLYITQDNAGALSKYSFDGTNWVFNNTIGAASDAYRDITGQVDNGVVTLFATRKGGTSGTGGGELVKLIDTAGFNAANNGTPTILATAAVNTAFRGVAFAPEAAISTYTLDYTAGANGSISGNTSQTVAHGDSGTAVTAVPNTGYHFVDWSDGSTANPRTDANVTANLSVTANFAINTYTLSYTAGANGSISGNASQTVNHGDSGTAVTAVPDMGYQFVNWSDGSTANPRTDVNVTADISVTANFAINTYTLSYTAGANGSISGNASQTVNHGASGSAVTAVPASGYHFVDWSDGSTANPRTDANVTADISVTANFGINMYQIHTVAGAGGSISPAGPIAAQWHAQPVLTITPNAGYGIASVQGCGGTQVGDQYTLAPVEANCTVEASFVVIVPGIFSDGFED